MLRSLYSWGGAMANVSISFHRCEFCGAYHLMTSRWFGEWILVIEDEDTEYFVFECIEYVMLPMPTRPPPM